MTEHPTRAADLDESMVTAWREHRRYVLDIAFRMLGDLGDAEDAVQEAFIRLHAAERDEIDDERAWLVTVVSRLCLDQLRTARRRRLQPLDAGAAAAPPVGGHVGAASVDPVDRVTLDDSVRIALHLVLQRLTPGERTAFVLHDVFQFPFERIAEIVGRSPDACRQLASRGRRHIADDSDAAGVDIAPSADLLVARAFIDAASTGDLDGLLALLDPAADVDTDLGGGRHGGAKGATRVARTMIRYMGPGSGATLLSTSVAGRPGVLAVRDGEAVGMLTLTIDGGRIEHIDGFVDPAALAVVTASLHG